MAEAFLNNKMLRQPNSNQMKKKALKVKRSAANIDDDVIMISSTSSNKPVAKKSKELQDILVSKDDILSFQALSPDDGVLPPVPVRQTPGHKVTTTTAAANQSLLLESQKSSLFPQDSSHSQGQSEGLGQVIMGSSSQQLVSSMPPPPPPPPPSSQDGVCQGNITQKREPNPAFRRTFHLGRKRYMVFDAPQGQIESIHLKEWDGMKVSCGVKLSLPMAHMILHYGDLFTNQLDRVIQGQKDVDLKKHVGRSVYLSVNSPYKNVGLRTWRLNAEGNFFATRSGITLKGNEWREALKHLTQLWAEYLELYQTVSCLLNPNTPDHDSLDCEECGHMDTRARGEVQVEIPLE